MQAPKFTPSTSYHTFLCILIWLYVTTCVITSRGKCLVQHAPALVALLGQPFNCAPSTP